MNRTDRPTGTRRRIIRLASLASLLIACAGCATTGIRGRGKPLVPTDYQTRTGPFLIRTNDRLEPGAPVVAQLNSLEGQIQETLGLKVEADDNPVEIYILDDRDSFDQFLRYHYPDLPKRRAFFLANGKQRVIYTFKGDRTEEDIRHEATHALLHSAVGNVPLWLDEGLAEYFEGPTRSQGINPEHVGRLPNDLAAGWSPDLARLESLKLVRQMTTRDYRESWAWVHYLLNDSRPHKAALLSYLADLRTAPDARPLSARIEDAEPSRMLAHLDRLRDRPPIADASVPSKGTLSDPLRDPTVRLQSAPSDPVGQATPPSTRVPGPNQARRRSIVGRLFGWLGD